MTEQSAPGIEILWLEAAGGCERIGIYCQSAESEQNPAHDLGCLFALTARRFGRQPALVTSTGTWTYREVLDVAMAVCGRLQERPTFRPGSRVVLALPNSFEYVAAFYGILLAGGVVVPVAPKMEQRQFHSILQSTSAAHIISAPRFTRLWEQELGAIHLEPLRLTEAVAGRSLDANHQTADCLAVILFTGGSSGTPKGVMLSHRNLIQNATSIQRYLNICEQDRPLCVLPFYHAFGNSVLQSHLLAGSQLIIDGNATFPETLIEAVLRHHATSLSGVPDLFRFLLERSSLESLRHSSLRYLAVAGGALPHDLAKSVADRIQPAQFFVMYGQTEATARLAYVPPERFTQLGENCIGRAIPGVELQVVDEHGGPVAPGDVGEIRARGPNIMLGYWGDSALTDQTIRDGWLYTGDLGSTDAEGWIFHRGRRNSLIKIAGYRLHPADVEDFVVRELPVQQAILAPYEHPDLGTRLALFVRLHPGVRSPTAPEIVARCREKLPRYMVPDMIQFVDQFPLNDALKIDRPRLLELAAEAALCRRKAV